MQVLQGYGVGTVQDDPAKDLAEDRNPPDEITGRGHSLYKECAAENNAV